MSTQALLFASLAMTLLTEGCGDSPTSEEAAPGDPSYVMQLRTLVWVPPSTPADARLNDIPGVPAGLAVGREELVSLIRGEERRIPLLNGESLRVRVDDAAEGQHLVELEYAGRIGVEGVPSFLRRPGSPFVILHDSRDTDGAPSTLAGVAVRIDSH